MYIGSKKQLLIDDQLIETREGLVLAVNSPQKHPANPVLVGDQPWEYNRPAFYGTVMVDEEDHLYKLWYQTYNRWAKEPLRRNLACYAISQDGIHWEKPAVGLFPFQNSYRNNIVATGQTYYDGFSVIKDWQERDPARKYKSVYRDIVAGFAGICVGVSPDGIHWTPYPNNPVIPVNSDTHHPLIWDEARQRYVIYLRPAYVDRRVARSESRDFFNWSIPEVVLEPDAQDPPDNQFYNLAAFLYEGYYFGLLSVFKTDPTEIGVPHRMKGVTDVELVCSRDGIRWERPARDKPFIPRGAEGAFDSLQIYAGIPALLIGDEIRIYYSGLDVPHQMSDHSAIGLVTLRRDGFLSLDAGEKAGSLTTKPFTFTGEQLTVNVDASSGLLASEILDTTGQVIPGYSRGDCREIRGDHLHQQVIWDGKPGVEELQGREIRVRFYLQAAKLFSFQFNRP